MNYTREQLYQMWIAAEAANDELHDRVERANARRCPGTAWVKTRLPNGIEIEAHPQHEPEDVARAEALGYPHVGAMTLDHDPLHALLTCVLGVGISPVLGALGLLAPPPQPRTRQRRRSPRTRSAAIPQPRPEGSRMTPNRDRAARTIATAIPYLTLCTDPDCPCTDGDICEINETAAHELLDALADNGLVVVSDADGSETRLAAVLRALASVTHPYTPGTTRTCATCGHHQTHPIHRTPTAVLGDHDAWAGIAA